MTANVVAIVIAGGIAGECRGFLHRQPRRHRVSFLVAPTRRVAPFA